jgi:predicted AlkP superfamily pyrophosphatase or phosphodiesterase
MHYKLIGLFLAAALTTGIAAENSARQHHVILITVDGGAAFYFDDPKAPIPNLRKIAGEGVVAKGMKVSNPAVTWPNHTTLVTGVSPAKHSLLYNGLMVPNKKGGLSRESERGKSELVAVPTVYDFLHEKGFSTAAVNWPATQKATTLDFVLPDLHAPLPFTTPQLVKELTVEKILDDSSDEAFLNVATPKREQIWSDIADYLMRTHKPNLMLLHFLIADGMQHRFGPQSPEAYEALGLIDQYIGRLFDTLEKNGLRESTTILIGADHGFARFHKQVVATAILRKAGLLETGDGKTRVQIISEGGTAMVYLRSKNTKEADRRRVIELFKNQEGVEKIIEPKDFAKYGYPSPKKNPQMADLVLSAKDDYSFSSLETGSETIVPARGDGAGSHGYLATNPKMNGMFIAAGREIAKGKKIGMIENIDVAPTIAYLLGENLPHVDGKVLKQILANP